MNEKKIDENRQAILLLTCYFSGKRKCDPTPLTQIEYGRFALWLKHNQFQPKDLFSRFTEILQHWHDPKSKITVERLQFLLGRGMAMGLALEKWQSAGIWILTRSDIEYPARLKKHLGTSAPPVLFGVGNKQLLNGGGLAIIGSRNIDDTDQLYTKQIAQQAAMEGINIVSGGARGVDEAAMLAALSIEGTAIGILANDLLKTALSSKWRGPIKSKQVVLISPFYPEAGFNVGNAMGRNKYIYCLSDYALVVRAEEGSGGTWSGAIENLKKTWVPLFVKAPSDATGNIALKKLGAQAIDAIIPSDLQTVQSGDWLVLQLNAQKKTDELSTENETHIESSREEVAAIPVADSKIRAVQAEKVNTIEEPKPEPTLNPTSSIVEPIPGTKPGNTDQPYEQFIELLRELIHQRGQITLNQLKVLKTDLGQKKITAWLDRANDEGVVVRQGRMRTYTLADNKKEQPDLFSS